MKKAALIFLASFLISPFAFAYESCVTPKTQKIDLYGAVREDTWREFKNFEFNGAHYNISTEIVLRLQTSICVLTDTKKNKSDAIYFDKIALLPSARINLTEMIDKKVEVKGVLVLTNPKDKSCPASLVVESVKTIE